MSATDAPLRGPATSPVKNDVLDAALALVARVGVARTTLGEVARHAGTSRATLYRLFPGGKGPLLTATARRELTRALTEVATRVDEAATLEDALTVGLSEAARRIDEQPALQFVLAHEPGLLLPYLAFDRLTDLFVAVSAFAAPHLARFVPAPDAPAAAEWVGRVLLSYLFNPAADVDLRRPVDARRLVRTFLLPGLLAGRTADRPSLDLTARPDLHPTVLQGS
ncbi:TetR/AcrR family transcriptional regulator [soil metagenome]